ncbi:LysM peptidoglycan-binding domain-containing protein [Sporosarcina sp. ANT_H38]|uniref:glycoside hydrolase family 18 protein n=1 Tax=Sporosarcina sp. ANT_H38 TaxID=2597358 RepID=UPI0011F28DD9|nr:glycoside hydrolase family 18 protein [Sporosarcina sp. ANT_H38]KAA0964967.1 LysM peptidoglycan-binding domain-containing protein [Sporosarcina sp. ANT_H38]
MQIHVVQKGQSLYGIAQAYGINYQEIAQANEIPDPSRIVVGQALVIPIVGSYHWIQPGQSLFVIAEMYGMTVNELARVNGISPSQNLRVGQRLYIPPQPKKTAESLLYVEPRTPVTQVMIDEVRRRVDALTYLAMFSYEAQRDGSLKAPTIDDIPNIASAAGAANALVVSNLENFAFNPDLAHVLFTDQAAQNRLFGNLIQVANEVGYKDIHFDFELLYPEDRELYNSFLRNARDRFHNAGFTISSALAPMTSDVRTGIYGAHDYRAHGEIVDFVSLMTYEWGYTYSDPQAVSPIGPVRNVIEYAVSQIPSEKIFLGQNLYGYDWSSPYPSQGGSAAKAISPQNAVELAVNREVDIQYDYVAQAPHFTYTDDTGVRHEVWFEDARSIQAKFDLIKEFNLRGIMYWKLGLDFPQNWLLLENNFNIRKIT